MREEPFMVRKRERKSSKLGLVIGTVFVLGLAITGCGSSSLEFTKTQVQRSKNNPAAYSVYSALEGKITYQFDQNFYDEKVALNYVEQFKELEKKAQEYTGVKSNNKITICVLETTPFGGTYVKDHTLYCTISDLKNGDYQPWFMQAYYNLQQPWTAFGINQNIGSKGVSKKDLAQYYEKNENLVDLTMFGGCFIKEISSVEDYEVAVSTASQFVDYLVKNKMTDKMIQGKIGTQDKQNWLSSIGVKNEYKEAGEDAFGKSTYTKNEQCVLEIQGNPTTFQMNLTSLISNSADMRNWVIEDYEARTKMKGYLEKYLNKKQDEETATKTVYLVTEDTTDSNYDEKSNTNYYTIQNYVFSFRSAYVAAYDVQKEQNDWREFVLSYWMISNLYKDQDKGIAKEYQLNMDEHKNEDYFTNQQYEAYLKNDTDYMQNHLMNIRLMNDIRAKYTSKNDQLICSRWEIIQNKATEEEKLSELEELSFINYIGEQYGEDVVVRHLLCREDFQNLTGKSTRELVAAWRTYLDTLKK